MQRILSKHKSDLRELNERHQTDAARAAEQAAAAARSAAQAAAQQAEAHAREEQRAAIFVHGEEQITLRNNLCRHIYSQLIRGRVRDFGAGGSGAGATDAD